MVSLYFFMDTLKFLFSEQEIEDGINELLDEIWNGSLDYDNEIPKIMIDLSAIISFLLPKISDSSLLEIDDLLYPNDDIPIIQDGYREHTRAYKYYFDYNNYENICVMFNESSRLLDATVLQMLENNLNFDDLPDDCLFNIRSMTNKFQRSLDLKTLCLILKLLVIRLKLRNPEIGEYFRIYLWNLQNLPESKDPKQMRIISYIKRLSGQINTRFQEAIDKEISTSNSKNKKKYALLQTAVELLKSYKSEKFDSEFIKLLCAVRLDGLLGYNFSQTFLIELLHKFFMSATNENEKLLRIKDFFKGLHSCDWLKAIKQSTLEMIEVCWDDDKLRYIHKYHGYQIKPYLSDATASNDVIGDMSSNDIRTKEANVDEIEVDYVMEKHFVYDPIMKSLHVWTILHDALIRHHKLAQANEIFNCELNEQIVNILQNALNNPSSRGKLWILETFLEICLFMFQMHDKHNMMEALIKMVKGEEISEATEERLFFFIEGFYFEEVIYTDEESSDNESSDDESSDNE